MCQEGWKKRGGGVRGPGGAALPPLARWILLANTTTQQRGPLCRYRASTITVGHRYWRPPAKVMSIQFCNIKQYIKSAIIQDPQHLAGQEHAALGSPRQQHRRPGMPCRLSSKPCDYMQIHIRRRSVLCRIHCSSPELYGGERRYGAACRGGGGG